MTTGGRANGRNSRSTAGFISSFNLEGSQHVPRNLWLNLADLQDAVEQPKRVNAIFASGGGGVASTP